MKKLSKFATLMIVHDLIIKEMSVKRVCAAEVTFCLSVNGPHTERCKQYINAIYINKYLQILLV